MIKFLTVAQVEQLHRYQIERFGGSEGLRDPGGLDSAVAQPQAGLGETYFHRDLFEMAAAYLFHLNKNHAFLDGNKRVSVHAALVFLELNGQTLEAPDEALYELAIRVACGEAEKAEIADFLRRHSRAR
ncbi:MAG: type II toxin-antitoxin system death-on-curing family toxin [Candidatus Sericytochromatia bacterium]